MGRLLVRYVERWLSHQALVKFHSNYQGKLRQFVHYKIHVPNQLHMMDIVYLPDDVGFKYCFTYMDICSRYAACVPIKNRQTDTILCAIHKVYTNNLFDWPKVMQCDGEFKNKEIKSLFESQGSRVKIVYPNDKRKMSILERFHKTFEQVIFKRQDMIEFKNKEKFIADNNRRPTSKEMDDQCLSAMNFSLLLNSIIS